MAKANMSIDDIRDLPPGDWLDRKLAKALGLPTAPPYSIDLTTCFVVINKSRSFFRFHRIKGR
jgi:hypothetical protein